MTNGSKKVFGILFSVLFWLIGIFTVASTYAAENDGSNSLIDALAGNTENWASSVTATGISASSAKIQFPVFVANDENITSYAITYIKNGSIATTPEEDLILLKEKAFPANVPENGVITLEWQELEANTSYNYVVYPINKEGTKLEPSEEKSFKTLASDPATPGGEEGTVDETLLGAADTASANITYAISGSKITVKWIAITGADKFMISMKEATDRAYKNIGEELVSKKSYSFIVGKLGLYSVKLVPVDTNGATVGAEKVLSVKVDSLSTVDGKGTPATWPGLNIILMSTFLLMLIYVVYRFRTTS